VLQALSQISINPVTEGGGSSLKVPDALAAGKPLLSTPFGARGFYADGCEGIVLAELDQFAERLRELLAKPAMLRKLSNDAVRYARGRLDWPVVVEQYAAELRKLIGAPGTAAPSARRLLVVTHRYTQPPRGGAEHYLDQVLARLGRSGRWSVSVATVDGTDIRNQWQFSAAFSDDGTQCGEHPSYLDRLYKFQITGSDPSDIFASCRRLYELWAMESVRLGRLALATLAPPDPVLLGGWYLPEVVGTRAGRWSTPEAELFLPLTAGETRITVNGFALESKRLLIKLGGQAVSETLVPAGSFAVSVTVAAEGPGILALCTSGTITSADPRALGVFIDALSYGDAQQVCFDTNLLDAWQTRDAEGWISALAALTMERSREVDELFSQTRGPQSDPLRRWLFDHIDAFDVVLAHELPFSTLTLAADVAYECGVPCVLLPHIHVEDRYYHWQSYVKAFRQATLTMVAPYQAKALYFDKISGVRSIAVAGGGIDLDAFGGDIGACRAAFRNKYGSPDPFVLVLGRKSGAKRYSLVIEGVERARAGHPRLRLVMIGPDEDERRIDASYVSYLGPQPRAVVLGALHECIALANMSQSESFGIVILEAWMAGKPVAVNRNCLAFQELVVSGRDGWLCQGAADLAEAFSAVLDSPVRSMQMGETGRRKASEYSWDRVAEQIEGALAIGLEERAC
jgi:glycosyltransferase involved in cell wall biosynthesis